jgi:hypothetical protein
MDRALNGEGVVITRGKASVELKAAPAEKSPAKPKRQWTKEEELEWLRALRAQLTPAKTDAVTLVRQMREEGEE